MLTNNIVKSSNNLKYACLTSLKTGVTLGDKATSVIQKASEGIKKSLIENIDPQTTVSFREVKLEDCNQLQETVKVENYYDQKNLTVYNRFVHNQGTQVSAGIHLPELAKLTVDEQAELCYLFQHLSNYIYLKEGERKKKLSFYGSFHMSLLEPGLIFITYTNHSAKDITYVNDALKEIFGKMSDPEKLRELLNNKKEILIKEIKKDLSLRKRNELNYNSKPDVDGMRYKFPEIHNAAPSIVSEHGFWFTYFGGSVNFGTSDIFCPIDSLEKLADKESDYLDVTFNKLVEHITHKDKYVDLILKSHCNEDQVESIINLAKDILLKDSNEEIKSKVSARTYDRKTDSDKPQEIPYQIEDGKEGFRFNRAAVMHHIYLDDLVEEGIDAIKVDLIMRFLMELYYKSIENRCKEAKGDLIKTKVLSFGDRLKQLNAPANFRYLYAEIENEEKSTEDVKQEVLNFMIDLVVNKQEVEIAIKNANQVLEEKERNELEWPEYMDKDLTTIFEYVPTTDNRFGYEANTLYLCGQDSDNYEKFKKAVQTLNVDEVEKVVDVLRRQYTVFYADRNEDLPELDDEERRERENGWRNLRSKQNI